jgi:hypothetical protein
MQESRKTKKFSFVERIGWVDQVGLSSFLSFSCDCWLGDVVKHGRQEEEEKTSVVRWPRDRHQNLACCLVIQVMVVDVDTGCLLWITTSTPKHSSSLAEVGEHGVDELERLVDLLADLGAGQDDLTGDEDE